MNGRILGFAAAAAVSLAVAGASLVASGDATAIRRAMAQAAAGAGAFASDPVTVFEANGKKSGYLFATPETRAMQDDDFENPGFLVVQHGEGLWTKVEGGENKSCASCHGAAASMRGIGATYPKVSKDTGKLAALEDQINYCRTERMKAPAYKWETEDMLGISTFVMNQSRGLPMSVAIDGPAQSYFERGEKLYSTRRGQLNLACTHCHENNAGNAIRSDVLSEGRSNGFPLYRLKWQRVGSFHYRMEECYGQIRAEPEPYGSEELTMLQLYVAWRSNGLPIETPAVRR